MDEHTDPAVPTRLAIAIHVVHGHYGYAWELRTLDGRLRLDSQSILHPALYRTAAQAFVAAANVAVDYATAS